MYNDAMKNLLDNFSLRGQVKWTKTKNGILVAESPWMENQVLSGANKGISMLLDRLANITTYTGIITYGEIGDDATATNPSQAGLLNALVRTDIAIQSRSGLTADFRFFFADATTPDDTYYEFGMIVDGTATIGTGQAFNRLVLGSPLVKAAGEDTTIVCRVTGSV